MNPRSQAKKPVAESHTTMTELVLPNDANTHGNILGGRVMHFIDLAGAMAAYRFCRQPVVTVSVDSLVFLHPIKVGQLVLLDAIVTRSFTTSLEVLVEVSSEEPLTGHQTRTATAFLTFVALDVHGKPVEVPRSLPATQKQRRLHAEALERRKRRLEEARKAPSQGP